MNCVICKVYNSILGLALLVAVLPLSAETLKIAVPNPIGRLDSLSAQSIQDRFVLPLIYENLFIADTNDEIKNNLVKNWHYDSKLRNLGFEIVNDHHFSDGSPVTPQAVLKSLRRLCYAEQMDIVGISGCDRPGEARPKIKLLNNQTIEIGTNTHPSILLYQLANRGYIGRLDSKNNLLGSGPYVLKSSSPERVVLIRNKFYPLKNAFDEIEFTFIPQDKLLSALSTSYFHQALMYLGSELPTEDIQGYSSISHARFVTQSLVLNPFWGPFKNKKIRKAFANELSVSRIEDCKSNVSKANGFIPEGIIGSFTKQDEDQKATMKEYKSVFAELRTEQNIKIFRHILRKNLCEENILKRIAKKFNIIFDFVYKSDYKTLFRLYSDPKTPAYIELYAFISRDPTPLLRRLAPGTKQALFFKTDQKYEKLLKDAWNKPTVSERFKIYRMINTNVKKDSIIIPLYYVGHIRLIHKCLNITPNEDITYNPNSFLFLAGIKPNDECRKEIKNDLNGNF